jgi:hypothetical protein
MQAAEYIPTGLINNFNAPKIAPARLFLPGAKLI